MIEIILFFKLLIGHAIADYCLQNDYISVNKNRNAIPKGYNPELHGAMQTIWPYVLSAHALSHAGFTFFITNNFYASLFEFTSHWLIDFGKCEKWYGIHTDQWLHIFVKVIIVFLFNNPTP